MGSNILILTAGYGEGHNAAARGLREGFQVAAPDVQVEVADPIDLAYGKLNTLAKKAYIKIVTKAPHIWTKFYDRLNESRWPRDEDSKVLTKLRDTLKELIETRRPSVVVTTYPVYPFIIQHLYPDAAKRAFRLISVVTDSISVNSIWWRARSDLWVAPNELTAAVMRAGGVPADLVAPVGFPVSPRFIELAARPPATWTKGGPTRLLLMINHVKGAAADILSRLLATPGVAVTVVTGRDAVLKGSLTRLAAKSGWGDRAVILGWTTDIPDRLAAHHLVITKAGGATVQEAIAARCPLLINHVLPGQEEGNADLVVQSGFGMTTEGPVGVAGAVRAIFADNARIWRGWRENLMRSARPDAAVRIAKLILGTGSRKG
jgi:processive 1,2-diacylglycerol beta-glucosyltransferase